jgi:hypothetical protein
LSSDRKEGEIWVEIWVDIRVVIGVVFRDLAGDLLGSDSEGGRIVDGRS